MKKMNNKGFTLIEMLVVIAIIAILVAIIIPTVMHATDKAAAATDAANLRSAKAEITTGMLDGTYSKGMKSSDTNSAISAEALGVPETAKSDGTAFSAEIKDNGEVVVTYGGKTIEQFAADAGDAAVEEQT